MITIPVHDLLLLPGVMFYFKKDMFPDRRITAEDVGEDILFMMLKEEKKASELQPDDFYPIGVSGKIEGIDDEGNVRVQAKERVELSDIEITPEGVTADASICAEIDDLPEQEEKDHFGKVKEDLLNFAKE